MASCLITIGGTSGEVLIKYKLGGVDQSMISTFGKSIYINDAATNITYTTLSGNATASSLCVTITELPYICYDLSWETYDILKRNPPFSLKFDAILLDEEVISIPETTVDRYAIGNLVDNINGVDERVKLIAGKPLESNRYTTNFYLLIRVAGSEIPSLRIKNTDVTLGRDPHYMYIKGTVASDCTPDSGYEEYTICETTPAP